MHTRSSSFQGDGDDVDLEIGYTDDLARNQPNEVRAWLSMFEDKSPLDHRSLDNCQYQYRNLEDSIHIRLLVLSPSLSPEEDLKCFLRHVRLDNCPQYEALSYVWGEDGAPNKIAISFEHLDIKENLHDSLTALRFERKERVLWVDALCINQNNEEEKNIQVSMMGAIYQKAYRVVIWLGKDEDGSTLMGFESAGQLHQIGRKFGLVSLQPPRSADKLRVENDLKIAFQKEQSNIELASREIWVEALLSLLKSPWFTRTWTIQEIALSNTAVVQSGRRYIPWDTLAMAIFILNNGFSFKDSSGEHPLIPENHRAPLVTAHLCVRARLNDVGRSLMETTDSTEQPLAH